jgi:hypothetical protein
MTAVGAEAATQAAWPPLTTPTRDECLLLDGPNG